MNNIIINAELKAFIPSLNSDEFKQLEENILVNGCRDPLVVNQDDVLVDGHNRYEICTKHKINFEVVQRYFDDLDSTKEWMILNQFGRRNLEPFARAELAEKLGEIYSKQGKLNQKHSQGAGIKGLEISTNLNSPINTREEVAKIAGVSTNTIAKAKKITELATDEVKEQLRAGKTTINKVYNDVTGKNKKHEDISEADLYAVSPSEQLEIDALKKAQETEYDNWLVSHDNKDLLDRLTAKEQMNGILRVENDGLQFRTHDTNKRLKAALAKIDKQDKHIKELERELAIAQGTRLAA